MSSFAGSEARSKGEKQAFSSFALALRYDQQPPGLDEL